MVPGLAKALERALSTHSWLRLKITGPSVKTSMIAAYAMSSALLKTSLFPLSGRVKPASGKNNIKWKITGPSVETSIMVAYAQSSALPKTSLFHLSGGDKPAFGRSSSLGFKQMSGMSAAMEAMQTTATLPALTLTAATNGTQSNRRTMHAPIRYRCPYKTLPLSRISMRTPHPLPKISLTWHGSAAGSIRSILLAKTSAPPPSPSSSPQSGGERLASGKMPATTTTPISTTAAASMQIISTINSNGASMLASMRLYLATHGICHPRKKMLVQLSRILGPYSECQF